MFADFDWIGAMRSSPVMLIILACSVITFGLALERVVYFWKRRGNPEPALKLALEKARGGIVKEAALSSDISGRPPRVHPSPCTKLKSGGVTRSMNATSPRTTASSICCSSARTSAAAPVACCCACSVEPYTIASATIVSRQMHEGARQNRGIGSSSMARP